MLAAWVLLIAFAQGSEPALFGWQIEGLSDRGPSIVVTVTPTPFGHAKGIQIKRVRLAPTSTRTGSRPRSLRPNKIEVSEWTLRSWFTRPQRRFQLTVTLSDGTTHRVDPWASPRNESPRPREVRPGSLTAPPGLTTLWGE